MELLVCQLLKKAPSTIHSTKVLVDLGTLKPSVTSNRTKHYRTAECQYYAIEYAVEASKLKSRPNHSYGCLVQCTEKQTVKRCNVIRNNKYTYSEGCYTKSSEDLTVIRPEHVKFTQLATNHLSGHGCLLCVAEYRSKVNRENPTGWPYSNWIAAAEKSKESDSCKVYIIKCYDKDETFYKIGGTYLSLNRRFRNGSSKALPYQFEPVLKIVKEDGRQTCNLEKELQASLAGNKYIPKKKFHGMYECCFNLVLALS